MCKYLLVFRQFYGTQRICGKLGDIKLFILKTQYATGKGE